MVNEGAGQVIEYDGRRVYGVCAAEKGVFRFTLTTRGRAGHASIPRIGDNALAKMAPVLEALQERPARVRAVARARGADRGAGPGHRTTSRPTLRRRSRHSDPRVAVLVEPMLGVTLTPTMISASEKINVIPARADLKVDCRVPPELGEEHALQAHQRRWWARTATTSSSARR